MKTTLLFLATAMLLAIANPTHAQKKKRFNDSTAVIVFTESTTSKTKRKAAGEDNIIKIAPLGFVSGTFPLLYERRLTDFLSIQLAAGITARNYVRTAFVKDANNVKYVYPWTTDQSDEAEHIYSFDYRKPKTGIMISAQPRIYFESEGLEGPFLGLSFDHYKYNFEIPSFVDNGSGYKHTGSMVQEYETMNDFMVHFGTQTLYDRITLEYTTAVGLRNIKGVKYAAATDYNTNTLVDGLASYKQTVFNFNIGIKVGYHF